jgi:hypothetical protein
MSDKPVDAAVQLSAAVRPSLGRSRRSGLEGRNARGWSWERR